MKLSLEAQALQQYMPLVHARSYAWARRAPRIDIEDIRQTACLAFVEAYRAWTPDGGCSLGSFAWTQIDRRVGQLVRRERNGGMNRRGRNVEQVRIVHVDVDDVHPEAAHRDGDAALDARRVLSSLTERQALVMVRAAEGDSYAEIGRDIGVTRERVRQIAEEAITRAKRAA